MKIRLNIWLKEIMLLTMYSLLLSSCDGLFKSDTSDTVTLHVSFAEKTVSNTRTLSSSNEDAVNDITVLVFNSSGDLIGSGYNTFTTSPYTMDITTRVADGCTVYAIANTHSSSYFEGISTINELNAMNVTLTKAASLGTGSSDIMQSGEQTGVKITTSGGNISIAMAHLCSKINFSIVPASGITITGYQLCSVPLGSYITDSHTAVTTSPGGYGNFDAVTLSSSTEGTTVTPSTYYIYENLAGKNTSSTKEALRTSANAPGNSSYLLVYATGGNWKSVYRIYLGGTSSTDYTNYSVPRNYNYPYTINIDGSGISDVRVTCYPELINSASATSWSSNGSATAVTSSATATPGDYYYSDGTWGALANNPGKTPIAVVFSGTTSSTDQGHGWTHGYAMALTNASTGASWDINTNVSEAGDTFGNFTYKDYASNYTSYTANKDGYSETHAINKTRSSSLQSNYPAFYYALNYGTSGIGGTICAAPNGSSGWFLPSIGQWYDIYVNLGGMSATPPNYYSTCSCNWVSTNSSGTSLFAENINIYLTKAGSVGKITPDLFFSDSSATKEWYWSSTESDGYCSYYADLYSDGYTWLASDGNYKSVARIIRPVIAF